MSQRILVFENDVKFADEVKSNFERMGLAVDVAADGPSGLELAAAHRPDLILLTIELPGMNGFLVCKKIKKTAELESVPLVILSSEVDQETFEQHKKLRTRADEYIRKPIAFADLLSRVQGFVPHSNGAPSTSEETVALDIEDAFSVGEDDVIVLSDEDPRRESGQAPAFLPGSDEAGPVLGYALDGDSAGAAEMTEASSETPYHPAAAAAAAAFGSITSAAEPATNHSSNHNSNQLSSGEHVSSRSDDDGVTPQRSPTSTNLRAQPLGDASQNLELERIKRELAAAEERVQTAERRASQADQRASGAEKALDAAKRTGGASSRELLDLREQLNRKERELLDLREQVTARDKQLIEASDRSLAVERELQDARDKGVELQRDLDKKSELVTALTTDKDSIRKRLDDTKARAERGEAKVKDLDAELSQLKARHPAELDELRAQHNQAAAALREESQRSEAELREAHSKAEAELRSSHAASEASLREDHANELTRLKEGQAGEVEALNTQHAALTAAREAAHADELSELREEHAMTQKATVERLEQEARNAIDSVREELNALHREELADTNNRHRGEQAALRSELESRHSSEIADLQDKQRQELARLGKLLSEAESRHALLEERHEETEAARLTLVSQLETMTQERDGLTRRNQMLNTDLERLRNKVARDEEILERVRKAMAIGLGLLEEQKQAPEA